MPIANSKLTAGLLTASISLLLLGAGCAPAPTEPAAPAAVPAAPTGPLPLGTVIEEPEPTLTVTIETELREAGDGVNAVVTYRGDIEETRTYSSDSPALEDTPLPENADAFSTLFEWAGTVSVISFVRSGTVLQVQLANTDDMESIGLSPDGPAQSVVIDSLIVPEETVIRYQEL